MEFATLSETVGGNLRRLRTEAGLTLEQFARGMRARGVRWNASRAGEFERGEPAKRTVSLALLVIVAQVMRDTTGGSVALTDLLSTDALVELTDELVVTGASLAEAFQGEPVNLVDGPFEIPPDAKRQLIQTLKQMPPDIRISEAIEVSHQEGIAESRAAKSLGVDQAVFTAWSTQLWGRSLSSERDARSLPGDSPQRRGRITRELIDQMREAMEAHG